MGNKNCGFQGNPEMWSVAFYSFHTYFSFTISNAATTIYSLSTFLGEFSAGIIGFSKKPHTDL